MAINRKKNILLVGSDSGIVQELIKKIIYKGDNLTTVSRKKKPGFHSSHHYQVDLSDEKQVERFCSKIEKNFFDVFVYAPAIFSIKEIINYEHNYVLEEIMVNLSSPILISGPVIKNMIDKRKGKLLFIGSSSAYQGFSNSSVYCASKHGLLGFCRALAEETRDNNIRISCISPGTIDTKMANPLKKNNDIKSFIDPNEISELIFDLIYNSPESMWQEEIIIKRRKY